MPTRAMLALVMLAGCSLGDAPTGNGGTDSTTAPDCAPTDGFDESSTTAALPPADLAMWDGDPEREVFFRRPTERERESALLDDDTLLLILPVGVIERFANGDATVRLPVPIDGEIMTLGLEFVAATRGPPIVELRWTGECLVRETLNPVSFEYRSPGYYVGQESVYDGEFIVGRAFASDLRESLSVSGGTATTAFTVRGPYATDVLPLNEGLPLGRQSVHVIKAQPKP